MLKPDTFAIGEPVTEAWLYVPGKDDPNAGRAMIMQQLEAKADENKVYLTLITFEDVSANDRRLDMREAKDWPRGTRAIIGTARIASIRLG